MIGPALRRFALPVLLAALGTACAHTNGVFHYLEGVELQLETEPQRDNLVRALNDALRLPREELVPLRYRDYQGNEEAWDLRTLLESHLMPDEMGKSLGEEFYREIKSPAVQTRLRELLDELEGAELY